MDGIEVAEDGDACDDGGVVDGWDKGEAAKEERAKEEGQCVDIGSGCSTRCWNKVDWRGRANGMGQQQDRLIDL